MKLIRIFLLSFCLAISSAVAFAPGIGLADLTSFIALQLGAAGAKISQVGITLVATNSGGASQWTLDNSGFVTQGSSGGDIVFVRTLSTVADTVVTNVTAAGTDQTNCTALSRGINIVSTAAASTGVCLWASPNNAGYHIMTQNKGANDLKLYPGAAGGSINGGVAAAGITLTTAGKQIADCWYLGSNNYSCTVASAP